MIIEHIAVFIISFIVLSYSGGLLVRSLTRIAKLIGMSEYIIAFVLMSIITSIPELFISIFSLVQGVPLLSFGNILGANLIMITLVIGSISVLSGGIKIDSKISHQNFFIVFFITFLPILLAIDGIISRGDGLVLLISFVLYIWRLLGDKEYFTKRVSEFDFSAGSIFGVFKSFRGFFFAVALLIGSSFLIVLSSKSIASYLGSSTLFFGMLFVALGTSLPELVFGVKAASMDHPSMTLGNSIGSIAFNSTFILGLISVIVPIEVDLLGEVFLAPVFLFVSFILFNFFSYTQSKISRSEGVMLVFIYIIFLTTQII